MMDVVVQRIVQGADFRGAKRRRPRQRLATRELPREDIESDGLGFDRIDQTIALLHDVDEELTVEQVIDLAYQGADFRRAKRRRPRQHLATRELPQEANMDKREGAHEVHRIDDSCRVEVGM